MAPAPKIEDCEGALPASKARPQKNWPSATATTATTAPPEPKMEPVPSPDEPLAGATSTDFSCQTEAGEENWAPCAKHHALRKRLEKEIHSTNR